MRNSVRLNKGKVEAMLLEWIWIVEVSKLR